MFGSSWLAIPLRECHQCLVGDRTRLILDVGFVVLEEKSERG